MECLRFRALALLLLLGLGCREQSDSQLAGVVLITIDTLRADHVGVYGGPVPTPELDGLAAEGILVERAFTPTPTTGPAHASLMTGLYPWRHGVLDNAVALPGQLPTLAEGARAAGFTTAAFVSSYMLAPRFRFGRGFDDYVFEPDQAFRYKGRVNPRFHTDGAATTDRALRWLRANVGGQLFFLWVHYFDVHAPYAPPREFALDESAPVVLQGKKLPDGVRNAEELSTAIRGYRGEVAHVDHQLGRLVAELRRLGLLDDTAVVVTSDHGEGLGDHGHLAHGKNLFDELVRIPLIARGPGVRGGRRLQGEAQLEDLLPTLLAWMEAPPVADTDGVNLLPWWRGEEARSARSEALGRRRIYPRLPDLYYQARDDERWIASAQGKGERFDLAADRHAKAGTPLTTLPPELAAQLEKPAAADPRARAADLSEQTLEALEALGYAE